MYTELKNRNKEVKIIVNRDHDRIEIYKKEVNFEDLLLCEVPTLPMFHKIGTLYKILKPLIVLYVLFSNMKFINHYLKKFPIKKSNSCKWRVAWWYSNYKCNYIFIFFKGVYFLYTIHNYPRKTVQARILAFLTLKLTSINKNFKIVTVSEDCMRDLKKVFPYRNISVIHNGIKDVSSTEISNEDRKINHFVFVGNIEKRKGLHLLIDAYIKLKKDCPT